MEFEWDEIKDRENRRKHGFDFAYAVRIFNGPVRQFLDPRPWGEWRIVATGQVGRPVHYCRVYPASGERHRIISARPAALE